jgi:hypothetical protein
MSQLKGLAAIVRGGMAENNQVEEPEQTAPAEILDTRPSPKDASRKIVATKTPLRITGKSSNPAYEPVKVYVRSEMRKKAVRKWEDEGGRDLSDLVEVLFSKYLNA